MSRTPASRRTLLVALALGVVIVLVATLFASRNVLVTITAENAGALREVARIDEYIWSVVWSPDGRRVAFVRWEAPVEIRDARTLKVVREIGEGRKIIDFAFSPDPDVIAFCENGSEVEIHDLATGESRRLPGLNPQPGMTFSPDGALLATGGYGIHASLFEVETGRLRHELRSGRSEGGLTPVFSPDGALLAVGNRNSHTTIFDVESGAVVHQLLRDSTQGLTFSPDGSRLAISYVDGNVGLWDVSTGQLLHLQKAGEEIYRVTWSPDGSLLISAGLNADIIFWDPRDLSVITRRTAPDWVISATFRPDGGQMLISGGERTSGGARSLVVLGVRFLDWVAWKLGGSTATR